jgi:Zn-dependent M28 family amino/carboxypeptidase
MPLTASNKTQSQMNRRSNRPHGFEFLLLTLLVGLALLGMSPRVAADLRPFPPTQPIASTASTAPTASTVLDRFVRFALTEIRETGLRAHVRFLADDSLEGRDTGSAGGLLAARYIAAQLEQAGIAPAGDDGTYYQNIPFVRTRTRPEGSHLTVETPEGERKFAFGEDLILVTGSRPEASIRASLVFAGYGITAPEFAYDDYDGLDVAGKIVILFPGEPSSENANFFDGRRDTQHAASSTKLALARRLGAAAVIIALDESAQQNVPWRQRSRAQATGRLGFDPAPAEGLPAVAVTAARAADLFHGSGKTWEQVQADAALGRPAGFDLKTSALLSLSEERLSLPGPNVIGLLEGSDPALKDEVVIFTAHYDHIGRRDGEDGASLIYNGAWDNASGTASVLEIARAFGSIPQRPRRSVLFLFVTGEERGLLGSRYYTQHPVFPIEKTAANINLDMTEIFGVPREVVASGAERSSLMEACRAAARDLGLEVGTDPTPELNVYRRSDQFSFARVGVPAIMMRWGSRYEDLSPEEAKARAAERMRTVYHSVDDRFDASWSWQGMRRQAEAAMLIALYVAQDDAMPVWNEGEEFNRPRAGPAAEAPPQAAASASPARP